ncbi:methionyl-tRNA formyltransferase [bacterium]|nr:methionyl-tRNA formyltransferase [candidate division CSSED10-310 bacterium]
MNKPAIVFMGSSPYAVPILERLLDNRFSIVAVVTQPDRPKGRGQKVLPTVLSTRARDLNLTVVQPEKIRSRSFCDYLKNLSPDLIITAAYGKILNQQHLNIPHLGIWNVHASLLPKYRGAAPIHWAIIRGEKLTGVTIMKTNIGIDTGNIISQKSTIVRDTDTAGTLEQRLSELGAGLLVETIQKKMNHGIIETVQNSMDASYAPPLTAEDTVLDWSGSAASIDRRIRGLSPHPSAFSMFGSMRIKFLFSRLESTETKKGFPFGTVLGSTRNSGLLVNTGEGIVECLEVQPESKKKTVGSNLINGHYLKVGDVLGS